MAFQKKDGQFYAPESKIITDKLPKQFNVAAVGLDHGHIYGMCNGLMEAGAVITAVYDEDTDKVKAFIERYPTAKSFSSFEEILSDEKIDLVATASIPSKRSGIAVTALESGKHVFSDKPGCTTLSQLEDIKVAVSKSNKKYGIYFSERLHVESSQKVDELIKEGVIGRVLQVMILAPHRIAENTRPDWFFDKKQYGGIITDLGSHQIEQLLHFTGSKSAKPLFAHTANHNHRTYTEFEDFGEVELLLENGATGYFRVDWFTPDGLPTWGDGRLFVLGTEGYIEIRKYFDISNSCSDSVYWVDKSGVHYENVHGKIGYKFFREFILDCMFMRQEAMSQEYVFTVMELAITLQNSAIDLTKRGVDNA